MIVWERQGSNPTALAAECGTYTKAVAGVPQSGGMDQFAVRWRPHSGVQVADNNGWNIAESD
jgi:hypothetical protein